MNKCNDHHIPIYKIKYKPLTPKAAPNEWLVCENCFVKKGFADSANDMEFIISLKNHDDLRLNIDHLYGLTSNITRKFRKILSLD